MEQVRNKAKEDFVRDRTKAPPDGYTVGLGGIAQNVLAIGSYAKLPYDPRGDFTFIGGM
jgi:tripartite-type tricarboxylate transporter receptor subunit TctC